MGAALIGTWEEERQVPEDLRTALSKLEALEVESESSKMRWKVSKGSNIVLSANAVFIGREAENNTILPGSPH